MWFSLSSVYFHHLKLDAHLNKMEYVCSAIKGVQESRYTVKGNFLLFSNNSQTHSGDKCFRAVKMYTVPNILQ
jgi:hypothetical protein